jgi:tetratricopeptide (TPR) repeat protein
LTRGKLLAFRAILVLFIVLVPVLALEAAVRMLGWQTSDDPFLHFGRVESFFEDIEIEGEVFKKVKARALYREREVVFSTYKDPETFRIFCVGGSASAGWPHPAGEIYSAYLESALAAAYPGRKIEVHNVSAQAYAAYRVRMIVDEIAAYAPDLVIIYSGNNEFLEPRRYATQAHWSDGLAAVATHARAYSLLRGSPLVARWFPSNTLQAQVVGGVAFEQWSKIERVPVTLRTDPAQFNKVLEHYRFSITSMLETLDDLGVPAILMTVPSNLRDWHPHVSLPADPAKHAGRPHYIAGKAALLNGENAAAIEHLSQAAAASPEHASTHFHLGRALEAADRQQEAYESFVRARDLDANPFRALSVFNDILRDLGRTFANARLVDLEKAFKDASAPSAPGFDLLLDYVHPTKKGNLLIAKEVFDAIAQAGYLGTPTKPFEHVPEKDDKGQVYSEDTDDDLQVPLLYIAMMMHQYDMAVALSERLLAMPAAMKGMDAEDAYLLEAAREVLGEWIELERRELLSGPVAQVEKAALEQQLNQLYRDVFGNYVEYQGRRWQ